MMWRALRSPQTLEAGEVVNTEVRPVGLLVWVLTTVEFLDDFLKLATSVKRPGPEVDGKTNGRAMISDRKISC